MSEFSTFISLGFHHIADPRAFDHLLFLVTLCAVYRPADWRKLLVLITAFTIGHSTTLLLAGSHIMGIPSDLVELLIPVTIVLTSLYNIAFGGKTEETGIFSGAIRWNYAMALFFGFIHGMGFANYFGALMGESGDIVWPLFSFNVGIEIGQIAIVLVFFGIYSAISGLFQFRHRDWNQYVSGLGGGGALVLLMQGVFENM